MDSVEFEIAPGVFVGGNHPVFIIAEIGQNHQGSYSKARKLIRVARSCGVHCVKFQKSDLRSRFTQEALDRPYENKHSFGATYGEHRRALELSNDMFVKLKQYAEELGLIFTATGMDQKSNTEAIRVSVLPSGSSADTTNLPLLKHASKYNKPLIISTGMTREDDLSRVYNEITKSARNIAIMHCTSCYPTPPLYANLNVIKAYKNLFPRAVIGYSGHEEGYIESVAAVAAGAKIIERHITLHHAFKGSDQALSLNPLQLRDFVLRIKIAEQAMGKCKKEIQDCELQCYAKLGKTIVAAKFLPSGTYISDVDMSVKVSSRKGYDPLCFYELVGRQLTAAVALDEPLMPSHFQ